MSSWDICLRGLDRRLEPVKSTRLHGLGLPIYTSQGLASHALTKPLRRRRFTPTDSTSTLYLQDTRYITTVSTVLAERIRLYFVSCSSRPENFVPTAPCWTMTEAPSASDSSRSKWLGTHS